MDFGCPATTYTWNNGARDNHSHRTNVLKNFLIGAKIIIKNLTQCWI